MTRRLAVAGLLLAAGLWVGCASAGPRLPALQVSPIDAAVEDAERRCSCRIGVAARHLETGLAFEHQAAESFEAASVIKIAVLTDAIARARAGEVDLSERWTLTLANRASESGWLKLLDAGLAPTWNDLATLMMGPSDNTATNAWIERLGIEKINMRMESLGFPNIRLYSVLPWLDPAAGGPTWKGLRFGTATPLEVAEWMARVAGGELLDEEGSRRIFAYLDTAPSRARIARRFSSAALWAGKTGTMSGVRNDAGILRTGKGRFVIVIFTDGSPPANDTAMDHPASLATGEIARTIVDEWSSGLPDVPGQPK